MLSDSLSPCNDPGEILNAEKNLGEERKQELKLSPLKSKLQLFRVTHIHKQGKICSTVYHGDLP